MRTWKPTVAGVLEVVAGGLQLLGALALILFSGGVAGGLGFGWLLGSVPGLPVPLIAGAGFPLLVFGVVEIAGGVCALKRRAWGLALAAGILALIPPLSALGVLAIVFLALARDEFGK